MAYKPKILTVSDGGTGVVSTTAYAVLCGGTTSTAAVQSIAGLGSSGQVLTSNGAGALPTFQAAAGGGLGYTLQMITPAASGTLVDATTYYFVFSGSTSVSTVSTAVRCRLIVPQSGTITKFYGIVGVEGTLGSSENVSMYVRVNDTTDATVSTTVQLTASTVAVSNASMSQAVSAGDFLTIKMVTPTWATNPQTVVLSSSIYIT